MKNFLTLYVIGFSLMSFIPDVTDHDLKLLYQNWSWTRWEGASKQQFTYKSSKEFGNFYGFQFRENGTFSICRGLSFQPGEMLPEFEVVDGKWSIAEDSIISLSYSSNNRHYEQEMIIRKLTFNELIVHFTTD